MNTLQIWISAARPKTLAAGFSPVLLGTTLALFEGSFNLLLFLMTLVTALGIQISANFANDYFDFIKGADTVKRKGPLRVTQSGFVSLSTMKKAIYISLGCTALTSLYLAFHGGLVISFLLALSLLLAVLYTGGPYPLAYLGLGDLFVLVFFGPVAVSGTYFLQRGVFSLESIWIGLGVGALSTAVLAVNNLRDHEEDAIAKKKTLVVRFGRRFGQIEYAFCIGVGILLPFFFLVSHPYTLISLFFILPALPCLQSIFKIQDPRGLNKTLAKTGQLILVYSLLFCIGWIL